MSHLNGGHIALGMFGKTHQQAATDLCCIAMGLPVCWLRLEPTQSHRLSLLLSCAVASFASYAVMYQQAPASGSMLKQLLLPHSSRSSPDETNLRQLVGQVVESLHSDI